MKKYVLIAALFLFLPFFVPKAVSAQTQGVFYCEWFATGCQVQMAPVETCQPGFEANPSRCSSITDPNTCNSANFSCVSSYDEPCYECNTQTNNCTPTDPSRYDGNCPYTDYDLCTQECIRRTSETKWRCDSRQGCIRTETGNFESESQCKDNCDFYKQTKDLPEALCDGGTGINTAIGCIPVSNINDLIAFILRWAIGIGGGIAFLLIAFAGFQIASSSGNPERLQAGRELLTSAIAGLIMLVFSVFILRIIGIDILGLGGLGL